jgi:hypothetical protein
MMQWNVPMALIVRLPVAVLAGVAIGPVSKAIHEVDVVRLAGEASNLHHLIISESSGPL